MFQPPRLTNAGKALYNRTLAGEGIQFTKIKLGKGTLTGPIATMTALVDLVTEIDASVSQTGDNSYVDISGSFSNAGMQDGFYWREIGLFAADPEAPEERERDILYCYQNAYDTADFIPAASVETVEKHITIPVIVSDAESVSCLLDPSLIYATKKDIENHNLDPEAHPTLRHDLQELDETLSGYMETTDAALEGQNRAITQQGQTLTQHINDGDSHVSAAEKEAWSGKAEPGDITTAIAGHNADKEAHPDIREELGKVKQTADDALKAIQDFAYVINGLPTQSGALIYNGELQKPSWNGYNTDALDIGGKTSATDAGEYEATFTPKGKYHWEGGTTEARTVTWSISRQPITTTPTQNGTQVYTGALITAAWTGYDPTKLTIGGDYTGTTAKSYNATFTPKDNYCWSGGSITAKTVAWKITKAPGTLSIAPTAVALSASATQVVIKVTRAGDGTISVENAATAIATATVDQAAATVTVKSVGQANGSGKITIKVAEGTNHFAPTAVTANVTADFPKTYGVKWNGGPETTWSRTDAASGFTNPVPYYSGASAYSSPFDSLQPWAGMKRTTDSALGELVSIPKYWYKWTKSGATMTLQISDKAQAGFSVSPAHADRGDGKGERNTVYVGRYHCASGYKSTTGVAQQVSITRANARSGIHNLGATAYQYDFAMYWTIMMLYLVEFADWNGQKVIGYGCSDSGSKKNNGQTDTMPYHTGTTATSRTSYGFTQYRYIEGLWDNVYDWVDGIYFSGANIYCIKNPASFSDTTGGTLTGTRPTSSNWISAWGIPTASGFGWALYPSEVSGSETTYVADYCNYSSSGVVLRAGGDYNQYQLYGPFVLYGDNSASSSSSSVGCRLQKLP